MYRYRQCSRVAELDLVEAHGCGAVSVNGVD